MRFSRSTSAWFFSIASGVKRGRMLAEVAFAELGVLVHRAGQEALAERAVGHEADAEFLARLEDAVGLRPARPQRILALQRGDRLHRVRAADGLRAGLGQAEVPDLALGDQLLDRARPRPRSARSGRRGAGRRGR